MTAVTVGVPVYNGADQLRECLECLLSQTLKDISIRIYDNASVDATPDIAREFESRDSRVRLVRHPENIKAMPNFHRIILDCETPHMMWRAHDDLCSPDYIERLHGALLANPAASLAAPSTKTLWSDGKSIVSVPRQPKGDSVVADILGLLFNSHPGWFYGLWKRDALLPVFETSWAAFPAAWAFDHLVLFPFLLDRTVAAVPDAVFIQRLVTKTYTPKKGVKPPVDDLVDLRRKFSAQCQRFIDERPFTLWQRTALKSVLPFYVDKRVYKLRKIIKRRIFGDRVPAEAGNEF